MTKKLSDLFRGSKKGATFESLAALADATVAKITAINGRLKTLENEVVALRAEAGKAMRYEGIFQADKTYRQGACVTHKGGAWVCRHTEATGPPPGNGWQLAIKSGRE